MSTSSFPLLSRDKFRRAVLDRDGHRCVICGAGADPAAGVRLDAHHILERRLWPDGGTYLANGATLCDRGPGAGCHWAAETTALSVETIRAACGICHPVLPPDLYPDQVYTKWGDPILDDGRRARGPLFDDPSVQKVLEEHLSLYTTRVKYPRTWHLPWSPGATKDDRVLGDTRAFEGRDVVVTEKMDGENFTGYADGCHARAVDGRPHPSRDWTKAYWALRAHDLPPGWRICAENLYAQHSLSYADLPSYLMGFSIWTETNTCLSWDDTVEWFALLDIPHVPVLWRGTWDARAIRALHDPDRDDGHREGYVVRRADAFSYRDFSRAVAKHVRAGHVGTSRHWKHRRIVPNGLADTATFAPR